MADRTYALDECSHGGDPFTCPPCQTPPRPRLRSSHPSRPSVTASYDGRCPGCDERIREGDRIALVDDLWCCQGCAEEADRG